jgi:hypothetical protein
MVCVATLCPIRIPASRQDSGRNCSGCWAPHWSCQPRDHPQTDGRTESANGVLQDTLRHVVGPNPSSWDEHLAVAKLTMNTLSMRAFGTSLSCSLTANIPVILFRVRYVGVTPQPMLFWDEQVSKAKSRISAAQQRWQQTMDHN